MGVLTHSRPPHSPRLHARLGLGDGAGQPLKLGFAEICLDQRE
jgi:hypothetical protein